MHVLHRRQGIQQQQSTSPEPFLDPSLADGWDSRLPSPSTAASAPLPVPESSDCHEWQLSPIPTCNPALYQSPRIILRIKQISVTVCLLPCSLCPHAECVIFHIRLLHRLLCLPTFCLKLKRKIRTFNWINQPDGATSQVYYLSLKYSSTCFRHPHAHHQGLQQLQQPLVYRRSLVIAVLLIVVRPAGPTTTNSTAITKLQR